MYLLAVIEAGNPKSRSHLGLFMIRTSSWVVDPPSHYPHTVVRYGEVGGAQSVMSALIKILRSSWVLLTHDHA